MKLKVLHPYRCREVSYEPGTIEVTEEEAKQLLADAPDCFQVVKEIEEPPADKMMRRRRGRSRTK